MLHRASWVVASVGAVALAFWLGKHTAPDGATPAAPNGATPPRERPMVLAHAVAPAGLTRDELREVVREELAQASAPPDSQEEPAPERQAAREVARAQATQLVQAGIADGVWSSDERNALRAQLPMLGERELHVVLSPLFQAINAQRLQLDGPPI